MKKPPNILSNEQEADAIVAKLKAPPRRALTLDEEMVAATAEEIAKEIDVEMLEKLIEMSESEEDKIIRKLKAPPKKKFEIETIKTAIPARMLTANWSIDNTDMCWIKNDKR